MIAKLGQGLSRHQVARDLGCVPSTVVKAARRFVEGGEEGLLDRRAFNGTTKVDGNFRETLKQVLHSVPTEFGWQRTTWTRELLGRELERRKLSRVAPCSMGRALLAVGARLGMPKPFVSCPWDSARRKRVLRALRRLVKNATAEEPVFFEDEMDVHLNPKVGRDWVLKGQRRYVRTPGQNKKRFVAGALNAATGKLTWVTATSKASELFHKLLWKLLAEYRNARRIHLVLDNCIIHSSKKTKRFLAQFGDRVVLQFLPPYCTDDNRIDSVWLDLARQRDAQPPLHDDRGTLSLVLGLHEGDDLNHQKLNPSFKPAVGVSTSRLVISRTGAPTTESLEHRLDSGGNWDAGTDWGRRLFGTRYFACLRVLRSEPAGPVR